MILRMLLFMVLVFSAHSAHAQQDRAAFNTSGHPVPRFVSLASGNVYMRTGPGQKYPILWEYVRKHYPVEVVMEFDVWRKIRDVDGTQGWVHQALLSGHRYGLIQHDDMVKMSRKQNSDSRLMAYLQPGALVSLQECKEGWCNIRSAGYTGWVQRKYIWGVYENEQFD